MYARSFLLPMLGFVAAFLFITSVSLGVYEAVILPPRDYKRVDMDHNLVIAGLARNCGKSLPHLRRLASALGARVVIVEDGSTDKTIGILTKWQREEPEQLKVVLIREQEEELTNGRSCERVERMVNRRNVLLQNLPLDCETILLVDCDLIFRVSTEDILRQKAPPSFRTYLGRPGSKRKAVPVLLTFRNVLSRCFCP